jgi:hypothetical protein
MQLTAVSENLADFAFISTVDHPCATILSSANLAVDMESDRTIQPPV